jgi:hypothetical protein
MTESFTIPYGRNHYCGPAALAYVLRSDPDEAARLLRQVSGKRSIHGVTNVNLDAALQAAQVRFVRTATGNGRLPTRCLPTLARWYNTVPLGEYIVCVTGHYIVVDGERMFDNRHHQGKPMALCPYLRRRVKMSWLMLR